MITVLIIITLFVAYANGANDVSRGIATLFGSGVSNYKAAVIWGTIWTVLGALTASVMTQALVATFSGKGLLQTPSTAPAFLLAVAIGAVGWLLIATRTGLPVSTTHSLTGALVGVALINAGSGGILWSAVTKKVVYPLLLSPVISFALMMLILPLLRPLARRIERYCLCIEQSESTLATPDGMLLRDTGSLNVGVAPQAHCGDSVARLTIIDGLHWISAGATSFFRGLNDTPKIIALGIAAAATTGISQKAFYVMLAAAMGAGSFISGRRVTETLAKKVVRLTPRNGFAANLVTSLLVGFASRLALPVSTTHVSSGAIIGGGIIDRTEVRWKTVFEMALAWIVTLPASAIIAAIVYKVIA
ncbi:MAG TPA: inorganic phosphate transporter [Thermoanaerobaculia bacterium]|nr:inorganic phosphate transporter [Thermoanaerobaculia bacterium]